MPGVFDPNNMLVVVANVIFFIVVQTLFFRFVATRQFLNVISNKVGIFNEYLKYDPETSEKVKEYVNTDDTKNAHVAGKEEKKKRNKKNTVLILKWIGPVLMIALGFLIYYIVQVAKQSTWSMVDGSMLSLVVLAYSTELLFYFLIVRQYEFYGDQELYSAYYNGMANRIMEKSDMNSKGLSGMVKDAIASKMSSFDPDTDTNTNTSKTVVSNIETVDSIDTNTNSLMESVEENMSETSDLSVSEMVLDAQEVIMA